MNHLENSKIYDPTEYLSKNWYRKSHGLKKAGVQTNFTPQMIAEFGRCARDIEYFCANYVKIIDVDKGTVPFVAREYQKKFWKLIQKNRYVISKMGRQGGKTTSVVGYILHYAIFNKGKTIGIAAQNISQAKELIHRFKLAYENLPAWLQVGVVEWQKGAVELGNGTRVFASSSNGEALRGKSLSLLVLDEFAHIKNDEEFMTATFPVVSSGKETKIVIISTPNGMGNAFHKIWKDSETGIGDFKSYAVKWNEIPGRDEAWKTKTEKTVGKRKFAQEYAAEFLGSSNTLVDADVIEKIRMLKSDPLRIEENECMKIFIEPEQNHSYVLVSDVARGYGNDYSTFSLFDVTEKPYRVVANYRCNTVPTKVIPYIIQKYAKKYNDAFVVVERNDAGGEVANILYYDIEYPEIYCDSKGENFKPGMWTSKNVKRIGCSNLRDLVETGNLIIEGDDVYTKELMTFVADSSGVYNASKGNFDDMVQNLWMFCYAIDSVPASYFKDDIERVSSVAHGKRIREILEDLPPVGNLNGKSLTTRQTARLFDVMSRH